MEEALKFLLYISVSALCLSMIYFIYRITKSVEAVQRDIQKISGQINPLLDSLNTLSRSVKSLSDDIRDQLQKINWIVDEVKSKVETVVQIEEKVRDVMSNPVHNIMGTIQGLKQGFTTAFNFFKK
jgi:uncharacterized protein YoxC